MSLFNIIGKECEDIIMEYKRQMDEWEDMQKQICRSNYNMVMVELMHKQNPFKSTKYWLEYRDWCNAREMTTSLNNHYYLHMYQ